MRIDLLLIDRRYYSYETYAAKHVSHCLEGAGIAHQLIYLGDGSLQEYLFQARSSKPAWTLSFVNLTPYQTPLCDVLQIPHFLWLEGSAAPGMHFLNSSYGKVGVDNRALCQWLSSPNIVYLPHGVEEHSAREPKSFEVVLFADLLDLTFLEKTWEQLFSSTEIASIKQAIELGDPMQTRPHFFSVEQYLNAQKNYHAITQFRDLRLDVFGTHAGNNWLKRLPQTVYLHSQLPFIEHFEVLKATKIALVEPSSPWYLPALAAGALPLEPDEERAKYYLDHPAEREKCIEELRSTHLKRSWKEQTTQLIELMS